MLTIFILWREAKSYMGNKKVPDHDGLENRLGIATNG